MPAKQLEANVRQEPVVAVIDLSYPGPQGPGERGLHHGSQEHPGNGSTDQKETRQWW